MTGPPPALFFGRETMYSGLKKFGLIDKSFKQKKQVTLGNMLKTAHDQFFVIGKEGNGLIH